MSHPQITVIVPCHDEADHVAGVIAGIPSLVTSIVAVDDGSSDATGEILRAVDDPRLVVVTHEHRRGVGAAMVSGYRRALEDGAEICVKMDGDGQMPPEHLPALLQPLLDGEADYAKGNRFTDLPALAAMPRVRLVGNGLLSFLTKLASGYWSVFDPTNGYTAVRAEILRRFDLSRLSAGYFFETSMLIELNIQGAVVRDVDLPARYARERSELSVTGSAVRFPFLLLRGLLRRLWWRYVIRDFNVLTLCLVVGLPMLLFGVVFGLYHWIESVRTGVPATAGTVLLAALPVMLGFQCLLTALALDMLYQPSRPRSREPRGG